ncbi:MAG: hypothetical protein WDO24_27105 [Pseudomonadota bacterium]
MIDSGVMRVPRFDPRTGMTGLETVRVSQASADQRRGAPGGSGRALLSAVARGRAARAAAVHRRPRFSAADLAPLALELAGWGAEPGQLAWLDAPPAVAYEQARALLTGLGALDAAGRITAHAARWQGSASIRGSLI